jgi:Domain of unknown function (DUF4262)
MKLWRARLREVVRSGRWSLVSSSHHGVEFCYTIGLWSRGRPELCIFGLESAVAGTVLNAVGETIVHGEQLEDGSGVRVGDWELQAFRVPNPGDILLRANAFYRRKPRQSVPALQLVYPDVHGVWPWEPDSHLFPGQQPMPGSFIA